MKIKNFMKETGKKLKKHSYNAESIMEEVKSTVSIMDVLKNKNLNPDIIEDIDFETTYYKIDKTGDPEYDMFNLKKMDLLVIKTGEKPTVGIYRSKTPGFAGLIIDVLIPVGNSYTIDTQSFGENYLYWSWNSVDIYSPKKSNYYIKKPIEDGSEFLDESAKYVSMDRRTVVDKSNNTVYTWLPLVNLSEDEMYEELKKVHKNDIIFMSINEEKDYYKINSDIRKNDYVYIDSEYWSSYQIPSSAIIGLINRFEAKIFIRNDDYDINSEEKIDDTGEDWNEPLNERVQRGTYLRRHGVTYHKVDSIYIFDDDTLYDMIKPNNTLLAGNNFKYEVNRKWKSNSGNKYLNIKKTTSENDSTYTSEELFSLIENGNLTLWLPVGEAEIQNRPLNSDGSEFDESYKPLNEDWRNQDEPGVGIIEYKGHKYYKVDAEKHIHKISDLMNYLVKDMTIFKGNPNGKELIYKGWEPQKYRGYKLNDNPYELIFKMDGNDRDFSFSFSGMYVMVTQEDPMFSIYIPELLAEKNGIKDEWELTSGEEFNECTHLKGEKLETLKEGTQIIGKKKMIILNKKGNHYNVLSEGKKYKYDINNLKYDYTHKKIKIFESSNEYNYNGKKYVQVPLSDLLSADLKNFIIEGETIIIDVEKKDYNKYLIDQSIRFEKEIMSVYLAPLTADESKIVTYSKLEKKIMDNKLELWLPKDRIQKILGYDDSKPLEKSGEEFNED